MRKLLQLAPRIGRIIATLCVVALAVVAGRTLWTHYQQQPWTRDGRVRADVVQISPDVSGLVTRVLVSNDQVVTRGQPLFVLDQARYELALRQAQAQVAAQSATLAEARREAERNRQLGDLVATETTQQSQSKVALDEAALAQATASRDMAALNLKRTLVTAPTDGVMSDLTLRVGDYVTAGKPVVALIDSQSLRVEGYFEETKLHNVRIGQPVTIRIMGEQQLLHGRVQSIASAIEDHDRAGSANLLPNINPTFSWVRLAQRVPVRIALDHRPDNLLLIAGRTATVSVDEPASIRTAKR